MSKKDDEPPKGFEKFFKKKEKRDEEDLEGKQAEGSKPEAEDSKPSKEERQTKED